VLGFFNNRQQKEKTMNYAKEGKDFLANIEQISYARSAVLDDGAGRGQRIIDVVDGNGLACTVTPDRALNIVECSYKGIPLVYRTPAGHCLPRGVFQQDWSAGLLTTCGLRNIGVASGSEPQHGRISQMAAAGVCSRRNENGDIVISGEVTEEWLFGPNLKMQRKITFASECSRITIEDEVRNHSSSADDVAILYHCNFGYPFVAPGVELLADEHEIEARDEVAAKGLDCWNKMDLPAAGFKEQCFRHFLRKDASGMASMQIVNRNLGIAVKVSYDTATLPMMVQWKNCLKNDYVLGLEPGNGSLLGREVDLKENRLAHLESGESVKFKVVIDFESL
jgi:hypothetical protein